jgi:hypothetical protein
MRALVLGGARSVFDDELAARAMGFEPDVIVATNHAGRDREEPVDHWCSFHQELFPLWLKERRARGLRDPGTLWSCAPAPKPKSLDLPVRKAANWRGSSGLLAVTVALEHLGATHVVLCGVPLTKEGEHYDKPGLWRDAGNYRAGWVSHASDMAGRVRSMGGWTASFFGEPDPAWLFTARAPG